MTDRATSQSDNIVPPRMGSVWVQTVDATARPYNIELLPFGGKAITTPNQSDHIYLTMLAETNDVFYFFDSATGSSLSDTATNAAGTPLTATTMSGSAAMCSRLPVGVPVAVRIDRRTDKWIQLKTASTGGVVRIWASSQPEV